VRFFAIFSENNKMNMRQFFFQSFKWKCLFITNLHWKALHLACKCQGSSIAMATSNCSQ